MTRERRRMPLSRLRGNRALPHEVRKKIRRVHAMRGRPARHQHRVGLSPAAARTFTADAFWPTTDQSALGHVVGREDLEEEGGRRGGHTGDLLGSGLLQHLEQHFMVDAGLPRGRSPRP